MRAFARFLAAAFSDPGHPSSPGCFLTLGQRFPARPLLGIVYDFKTFAPFRGHVVDFSSAF